MKLQTKEGKDEHLIYAINDITNEMNSWIYAFGEMAGLTFGSFLSDVFQDPHRPGEIISLINFAAFFFCLVFNCGFRVFSENREFQQKL